MSGVARGLLLLAAVLSGEAVVLGVAVDLVGRGWATRAIATPLALTYSARILDDDLACERNRPVNWLPNARGRVREFWPQSPATGMVPFGPRSIAFELESFGGST